MTVSQTYHPSCPCSLIKRNESYFVRFSNVRLFAAIVSFFEFCKCSGQWLSSIFPCNSCLFRFCFTFFYTIFSNLLFLIFYSLKTIAFLHIFTNLIFIKFDPNCSFRLFLVARLRFQHCQAGYK